LPSLEEKAIQALSLAAYKALGCRGWGRADIMNTSPGMTGHSLVPMSAKASGIAYDELCVRLLQSATLDQTKA